MMATLLLIYLLSFSLFSSYPDNKSDSINGVYTDEYNNTIIVNDSTFYYIANYGPMILNDTLAVCDMKRVQDGLYVINSHLADTIRNSRIINYEKTSGQTQSITVYLDFPHSKSQLSISVILHNKRGDTKYNRIIYPDVTKCIIPLSVDQEYTDIVISISPLYAIDYWPYDFTGGHYLGLLFYDDYIQILHSKEFSSIHYTNNCIDEQTWKKYDIQGEFVLIKEETIKWRNSVYTKKK